MQCTESYTQEDQKKMIEQFISQLKVNYFLFLLKILIFAILQIAFPTSTEEKQTQLTTEQGEEELPPPSKRAKRDNIQITASKEEVCTFSLSSSPPLAPSFIAVR